MLTSNDMGNLLTPDNYRRELKQPWVQLEFSLYHGQYEEFTVDLRYYSVGGNGNKSTCRIRVPAEVAEEAIQQLAFYDAAHLVCVTNHLIIFPGKTRLLLQFFGEGKLAGCYNLPWEDWNQVIEEWQALRERRKAQHAALVGVGG